jgi:hypothetical protein
VLAAFLLGKGELRKRYPLDWPKILHQLQLLKHSMVLMRLKLK